MPIKMPMASDRSREFRMPNVQVRLRRAPTGVLTPEDFDLVEASPPPITAGQMLCRARWLALEAHALSGTTVRQPGLVAARAVAEVVESRNDVFAVGACIELEQGLQLLSVSDGARVHCLRPAQNPPSTALGILGLPGMAAYFGLTELARVKARDIVLVCDAAGAAGAMAGQIAVLQGARAIGIVKGRERAEWVTRTARFTACIDTASEDLQRRLRTLAPNGVHVYFEDRAGESLLPALLSGTHLASDARVVIRGTETAVDPRAVGSVQIMPVYPERHVHRRDEFLREALPRYGEGLLVYREDVVEGLHRAAQLACSVVRGETFGQPIVRI
jgi:NADPH-dependent curcumin reductase